MDGMFSGCNGLTSLDLSSWNTSNVTSMGSMFMLCSGLTSLDISGWDIGVSTDVSYMFFFADSVKTIRMVGCNQTTIDKIKSVKPSNATIITE